MSHLPLPAMPPRQRRRGSLILLAALSLATAPASAQPTSATNPLPTAESLVERHVAASGGREALLRLRAYQQRATFEIVGLGIKGSGDIVAAMPNRLYTKMSLPGIGDIASGTNGTVAWTINPLQGPRILSEQELPQSREQADFQGNLLLLSDRFATMETIGRVEFHGQPAYKVRLVRKDGARELLRYFSTESGLLIGSASTSITDMGSFNTELVFSAYRRFGDILYPTRSESNAGTNRLIITIESMTFDEPDPAAFALPDAVKALIRP